MDEKKIAKLQRDSLAYERENRKLVAEYHKLLKKYKRLQKDHKKLKEENDRHKRSLKSKEAKPTRPPRGGWNMGSAPRDSRGWRA